jgi:hypothetical protein
VITVSIPHVPYKTPVHTQITMSIPHAPLTFNLLMWRIGRAPNSIPIYSYIQQDATLHSLFVSGNYSICFGWYFHPSSGAHTTVSTASGICHTVAAICRYRGRVGTGLSVLWVAYATSSHSGAKAYTKQTMLCYCLARGRCTIKSLSLN